MSVSGKRSLATAPSLAGVAEPVPPPRPCRGSLLTSQRRMVATSGSAGPESRLGNDVRGPAVSTAGGTLSGTAPGWVTAPRLRRRAVP